EDKGSTQLWLFNKDGDSQQALTAKGMRASEATFSPDGKTLAFISKRDDDEAGQVYLLPMNGPGEAQKLTDVPGGVYGMRWVGKHIYFISRIFPGKNWDEMIAQLKADKDNKVSAHQWNALPYSSFDHWIDEDREAHVFRIPAVGGEIEAITQPLKQQLPRSSQSASSYDIAPNEQWIAFTANGWDASLKTREVDPKIDIFLAKIGSGNAQNLTPDNEAPNSNPQFSPNGKTLAFTQQLIHGFYADTSRLVLMDMKKRQPKVINDTWDRSVSRFGWTQDSKGFYAAIDDAATSRIYHINANNGKVKAITKDTNFGKPVMAKDGTIVATNDSFLYPARLVTINPRNGKTTRLDS
ncbi:S9 family peptidase, partial [Shewanella sp. 0m-11]